MLAYQPESQRAQAQASGPKNRRLAASGMGAAPECSEDQTTIAEHAAATVIATPTTVREGENCRARFAPIPLGGGVSSFPLATWRMPAAPPQKRADYVKTGRLLATSDLPNGSPRVTFAVAPHRPCNGPASASVEALPLGRQISQQGGRLESTSELLLPVVQDFEQGRRPERVRVAEGTAEVRREAESEDRADVAVPLAAKDVLREAANGLVDHLQRTALSHLPRVEVLAIGAVGQKRVCTFVDALLLPVVGVKALLVLAAEASFLNELLKNLGSSEPVAERLVQDLRHLGRDVDAHLVKKRDRSHRKTEIHEGLVQLLDVSAFGQKVRRFVHVRSDDPGGVKADAVVDDDHRLALLPSHVDTGGDHPVRRLRRGDDLQQRHLWNWAEVVHSDHVLRPLCPFRDLGDRQRRGIRGEDAIIPGDRLHVAQHVLLEAQVLEDRLDDQVRVAKALQIGAAGDQGHLRRCLASGDRTLLYPLVQNAAHGFECAADARVVLLLDPNRNAHVRRSHVRNAAAHQPAAENADLLYRPRLDLRVRSTALPLQLRGGKEDLHQSPRDVGYHELAEEPRFGCKPILHSALEPDPHRLERFLRRGILAARLLEERLARLIEQNLATQWIVLECKLCPRFLARQSLQQTGHALSARHQATLAVDGKLPRRNLERALLRYSQENRRGNHLVDESELARLLRSDRSAGQDEVEGRLGADEPRQPLSAPRARHQSELNLRLTEAGLWTVGCNPISASQGPLQAAA